MDDVKKFAKAFNQPTLKATPRSNSVVGFFADALKPVQQFASNYNIPKSVPLIGGQSVADITGLTGAQGLLEDVSYGAPVVRGGSFQTAQVDPRVLDVAGLVPTGVGMAKGAGMYGKSLAKEIGRNINEGTAIGNLLDPRMNMIAYHGSPHSFDKFSMDKIGTGEGAQAYGHGLYFADSPDVAKEYVIPDVSLLLNGKKLYANDPRHFTATELLKYGYDETKKSINNLIKQQPENDWLKKRLEILEDLKKSDLKFDGGKGNLYKVDIADEAIPNLLLWDKPLSEQKDIVSKAKKYVEEYPEFTQSLQNVLATPNIFDGKHLYQAFVNDANSAPNASKNLAQYGIQGIRYLDAGSRGQGAGTMNTVVFDDSLVKILEKNGKPVGAK